MEYGELAINYAADNETISLKNSANNIVEFKSKQYIDQKFENFRNGKLLKFYCVEPVTVIIDNERINYETNTLVSITINPNSIFSIETFSNKSIYPHSPYPGPLSEYYEWF